ncbi:unnamed protein product [Mycena citricolor]|uniref:Uncharacterized protein n=1 Tax=Mycena citricolor TaxID=2018698 RepID=A0AAD2JXX0_9AGAR|nr:unnamed protein product [Mycena citricolor]CAK5282655.1 unnamed protein product [Mycena citricolor]
MNQPGCQRDRKRDVPSVVSDGKGAAHWASWRSLALFVAGKLREDVSRPVSGRQLRRESPCRLSDGGFRDGYDAGAVDQLLTAGSEDSQFAHRELEAFRHELLLIWRSKAVSSVLDTRLIWGCSLTKPCQKQAVRGSRARAKSDWRRSSPVSFPLWIGRGDATSPLLLPRPGKPVPLSRTSRKICVSKVKGVESKGAASKVGSTWSARATVWLARSEMTSKGLKLPASAKRAKILSTESEGSCGRADECLWWTAHGREMYRNEPIYGRSHGILPSGQELEPGRTLRSNERLSRSCFLHTGQFETATAPANWMRSPAETLWRARIGSRLFTLSSIPLFASKLGSICPKIDNEHAAVGSASAVGGQHTNPRQTRMFEQTRMSKNKSMRTEGETESLVRIFTAEVLENVRLEILCDLELQRISFSWRSG